MKGERHFEYIIRDITQEDAIRIADSVGIHLEFTDDSALFFADIDTRQVELLDKRLNTYTIQFTQCLCETAALERIRRDLDVADTKPPLWAIEALIRIIRRTSESNLAPDARALIECVITKYPEYAYLASWF